MTQQKMKSLWIRSNEHGFTTVLSTFGPTGEMGRKVEKVKTMMLQTGLVRRGRKIGVIP
jgi:hypothetical protein